MPDDREWPGTDEFDGATVWTANGNGHYHGDRECYHLANASQLVGWDRSAAWHDGRDPCDDCAEWPEHERGDDGS